MKRGKILPKIILPSIDGTIFDNSSLAGKKYLVTLFRFATCPFCNIRMAQLVKSKSLLGDYLEIVAMFEFEVEHLKKHVGKHFAQLPILADENRQYYKKFGTRKSVMGMLKGLVFRFPTVVSAMFKRYIPRELSSRFLTMPMSILVNEEGIVQKIYHGKDEGDHLPFEGIFDFVKVK